eukprot:g21223.t1
MQMPTKCPEEFKGVWWLEDNIAAESLEWVFKINENEWQKPSFKAKPGEPNANEITYMYRWRRVIGPDGNRTAAWDDMKTRIESPMPHQNCFTPWCPCWPLCISKKDRLLNMTYNSPTQVMILPPQFRTAAYSGCCIGPSCPCPCMCPCFANVYGVWTKNFPGPEATKIGKNSE